MIRTTNYRASSPFRRRSLEHVQSLLGRTALPQWYCTANALSGAVILMYHSIAVKENAKWIDPGNHLRPEVFRSHLKFLSKHRRVISFDRLVRHLLNEETIPAGTVVITFDDGYLDNLEVAFPLLEEYSLPATIFLPTTYIDNEECQWVDRLYTCFKFRTENYLNLRDECGELGSYRLRSRTECIRAYGELSGMLLTMTYAQRNRLLRAVEERLAPACELPRLTMSWSEIRHAAERYSKIEFGSHTQTHIDVTAHCDDLVDEELAASRKRIQSETQRDVRYFSFPYNRVSKPAMKTLERIGYLAAVADGSDLRVNPGSNRYSLPRYEAPASLGRLALVTSGAFPELSQTLTGRA